MTAADRILQAGRLLQGVLTDPETPEPVKRKIHDSMHGMTVAVLMLDAPEVFDAAV